MLKIFKKLLDYIDQLWLEELEQRKNLKICRKHLFLPCEIADKQCEKCGFKADLSK